MSLLDKASLDFSNQSFSKTVRLDALDGFASLLVAKAKNFSVLCFHGDLGAGKTTLIRSLSAAYGVDRRFVTSPTYVYLHHYKPKGSSEDALEIAHFDLYRLTSAEEFFAMGWEDYLEGPSSGSGKKLAFIEWPERLEDRLPKRRLDIELKIVDEKTRDITVYERS